MKLVGIGPDADRAVLTAIAEATGGQDFIVPDPTTIGEVFYQALSLMLCQPAPRAAGPGVTGR